MAIDCTGPAHRISPLIYGIAYDPAKGAKDTYVWELGATGRRWGGNPSSRYNWKLGNAWNTASDWFFTNTNYSGDPSFSYERFLDEDRAHGVATALTLPMLGWVAKDTSSYSFPVSRYGAQHAVDPTRADAGDGAAPDGALLSPGDPRQTSVAAPPKDIAEWVTAIERRDGSARQRSVQLYLLDNEPMLWHQSHRDVHPKPVGYDELLDRTLRYGLAVRRAAPRALIGGPAAWGWPAYFYSAIDAEAGFWRHPDRDAHGGVPLLAWYLRQLHAYEKRTGVSLLDVVDVHFYPQDLAESSEETCARRVRSTRALWDPTYVDESWINAPVELIPRLKRWIAEEYPGRGISLGEYNFGGEQLACGGAALAEALGRFGQQGLTAAFYWTYPPRFSPAYWAFRAYRNFDGHGGHFLDWSLPTTVTPGASLFASRDESGRHVVAVAINLEPNAVTARVALHGAGALASGAAYSFAEGATGPQVRPIREGSLEIAQVLPRYSTTVFDLRFQGAAGAAAPTQGKP